MSRVRILHTNPALGPLDYRVPYGMSVEPGSIVRVPLGPREMVGVVWEEEALPTETVGDNRLRNILEAYDLPPIGAPLRRLIEWTADYYLAPPQAVLRMALSSAAALEGGRTTIEYRLSGKSPDKLTPQRAQAIERIGERQGLIRELATIADVSEAVIRGLVKLGVIEGVEVALDLPFAIPDPAFAPPALSGAQVDAADVLVAMVKAREFAPVLLDGVTGSGKTEVYFEAIAQALREGRQTLVLLPEIALTEPFLRRFADRFGHVPVAWHSDLRQSQRRRAYRAIANGEALVTVGARSSLYLPYRNLGLIVVDEAHETSFKQEEGVQYHARDAAVMRGHFEKVPVILATATPAIETRQQVAQGRYRELKLPGRYGAAQMPSVAAINLVQTPPAAGLPRPWCRPWPRRSSAVSNRSSSSIVAALRRSPCAAIAAIASNAPIAPRGWSSIASPTGSNAIIAAMSSRRRVPARNARKKTRLSPAGRASSGLRTRSAFSSPKRAARSSRPIRSGRLPRPLNLSGGWKQAKLISSSARSL